MISPHNILFIAAIVKRPRTPTTNQAIDYQTADSDHVLKRTRAFGLSDEVTHYFLNLPFSVVKLFVIVICSGSLTN